MNGTTQYFLFARAFPAILTAIPFGILYYFFASPSVATAMSNLVAFTIIDGVTVPLVLIFLIGQLNRLISKQIFEKLYFDDGLKFPTTNLLLHSDHSYTSDYKAKLYKKIEHDFGIKLFTKAKEQEDETKARKRIVEAITQVRAKVGDGRLVLQHNIEYGFFRNLVGGSLIAAIFSAFGIVFAGLIVFTFVALYLFIGIGVIYLITIIFSRSLLTIYGRDYAEQLLAEYSQIE